MEEITLEAAVRVPGGTKVARSLRRAGRLPAIMYGHGETPQAVSLAAHDVEVALAHGQRTLSVA
ncbi:MAG: 50S ribosomal protein L25, partial [Phycisphaerae bacterium]